MKPLRIANAHGFWGDRIEAAAELIAQEPSLDYLTLDFLAELSLSIMAIQRQKEEDGGYAHDFVAVLQSLIPFWNRGSSVKVVTNAGGLNPYACANACKEVLEAQCHRPMKIGVITGDDVLSVLKADPRNPHYCDLDTQAPLKTVLPFLNTANAYLGAQPIAEALQQQADIVVTGRVTDPSLTVGPCVAHFGWSWTNYDRIASATIAGHLIECGTQATGGISTHWLEQVHEVDLGYPFIEMNEDGSFILTKSEAAKGCVTEEILKEQLLYEMGDPRAFLGPDVTASLANLQMETVGKNRVLFRHLQGKAPPPLLKVSASYAAGFKAEAFLTLVGRDAEKKGRICAESLQKRLERLQKAPRVFYAECLGKGDSALGVLPAPSSLRECVLRLTVIDDKKEIVEAFGKEVAPLVTSGPQGTIGYTSGRPHVRQVFGYWPCLIERSHVHPRVEILETKGCR